MLLAALVALMVTTVGPGSLEGQEERPPARDTLPADTTVADTVLPGALADTTTPPQGPRFPGWPVGPAGDAGLVFACDRACLLANPWFNLLEAVLDVAPGLTPLRGGYFGGPHHVLQGPFGPGFLRLVVDGRELSPLGDAQADLLRVPLHSLDGFRVYRTGAGLVIDASTRRFEGAGAYSRIEGATGQPGLQALRGVFQNGLGRNFVVDGGLDLFEAAAGRESNRLDFEARMGWAPGDRERGVEVSYRTQNLLRQAADTIDLTRRELLLRARGRFGDAVTAEVVAGEESLSDEEDVVLQDVTRAGASVGVAAEDVEVLAHIRVADDEAYPGLEVRGRTGWRPGGSVTLDAEAAWGSWEGFTTSSFSAGAVFRTRIVLPLTLRAGASAGTQGIPRPLPDTAERVSFDALTAGATTELGPYRVRGRASVGGPDRALPFEAPFDHALEPPGDVDVSSLELGVAGPLLPLGALVGGLSTVDADAFWRRHETGSEELVPYVPEDLMGARLTFLDAFFQGNLEVLAAASVFRRGRMPSVERGAAEPVLLSDYIWWTGHLAFRIGDFRLWWRFANPAGLAAADVPGVTLPVQVNAFGIRWEFHN